MLPPCFHPPGLSVALLPAKIVMVTVGRTFQARIQTHMTTCSPEGPTHTREPSGVLTSVNMLTPPNSRAAPSPHSKWVTCENNN